MKERQTTSWDENRGYLPAATPPATATAKVIATVRSWRKALTDCKEVAMRSSNRTGSDQARGERKV
jgi:hypothetical protein